MASKLKLTSDQKKKVQRAAADKQSSAAVDIANQPVSDLQLSQLKVEWVPHSSINPNKYNPNKMTYHERLLLRQSLMEDGWTQPVVTLPDRTIVDGEQRWTTAGLPLTVKDVQDVIDKMEKRQAQGGDVSESILFRLRESKKRLAAAIKAGLPGSLAAITGGLVPITRVDLGDDAHKMISTIRHNRARGAHQIDSMTAITQDLVALGLDFEDLETRLGMDDEEIQRFLQSAEGQLGQMKSELESTEFSQSWEPAHVSGLDENTQIEFDRSTAANTAIKKHQQALAERQQELARRKAASIRAAEKSGGAPLTQMQKDKIENEVAADLPEPERPAETDLKKIVLFVTVEEDKLIRGVCGEKLARGLVELCRENATPELLESLKKKPAAPRAAKKAVAKVAKKAPAKAAAKKGAKKR